MKSEVDRMLVSSKAVTAFIVSVSSLFVLPLGAVTISSPISYTSSGVVGTAFDGKSNANPDTETALAQNILNLKSTDTQVNGLVSVVIGGFTFQSDPIKADLYSGTIISAFKPANGYTDWTSVGSGYDYVLAKYDGKNAGYVLFAVNPLESSTIPAFPYNFWTDDTEKFEISHYVAFKIQSDLPNVPEGGATIAMLGLAFGVLGLVRFRRVRA